MNSTATTSEESALGDILKSVPGWSPFPATVNSADDGVSAVRRKVIGCR